MSKFVKIVAALLCMSLIISCGGKMNREEMDSKLIAEIRTNLQADQKNLDVKVERLDKVDNIDFYFYRVKITDPSGASGDQYIFYNGDYVTSDFNILGKNLSVAKELKFKHDFTKLDLTPFTLLQGKDSAKTVIATITDFECPYCILTNELLEKELAGKDDVAVYIIHVPLKIHNKAELYARIFEAGMMMGQNYSTELFSNEALKNMNGEEVIEYFANKNKDPERFVELIYSAEVNKKLEDSFNYAMELGIRSTPVVFINGKQINGYDPGLIKRALKDSK